MVTKTFICDVCKKSVGESELFPVTINVSIPGQTYHKAVTVNKDICRDCLEKKGIITKLPENQQELQQNQAANQKSLENKITDFLVDLGVVFEN